MTSDLLYSTLLQSMSSTKRLYRGNRDAMGTSTRRGRDKSVLVVRLSIWEISEGVDQDENFSVACVG